MALDVSCMPLKEEICYMAKAKALVWSVKILLISKSMAKLVFGSPKTINDLVKTLHFS